MSKTQTLLSLWEYKPKNNRDRWGIDERTEGRSSAPFSRAELRASSISSVGEWGTTVSRMAWRKNSPGISRPGIATTDVAKESIKWLFGAQEITDKCWYGRRELPKTQKARRSFMKLRFHFFLLVSSTPFTMDPSINPSSAIWQQAQNAEGRVYYYNVQTKATQWTKPQELMSPVEVCIWPQNLMSLTDLFVACSRKPAMEGTHHRCWAQVLVPRRNQAEHMGDACSLQRCACTGARAAGTPRVSSFLN
jgi:Splicing factor